MQVFDDKTPTALRDGTHLTWCKPIDADDVAFKASYYITSDIVCEGKVSALFDLIVVGNITASELDVKGKLVCTGRCEVSKDIIVHNDLWASILVANNVICNENIVVQDLDASRVSCDGNIVVGKTFAIETLADCAQTVICGETAFGSGKIAANTVITGEPIDLDDGEESIIPPNRYERESAAGGTQLAATAAKFSATGDYKSLLAYIQKNGNSHEQEQAINYNLILDAVDEAFTSQEVSSLRDAHLLLGLLDIASSDWFENWEIIDDWKRELISHFESLALGKDPSMPQPQAAQDLRIGDYVRHTAFENGKVIGRTSAATGTTVEVDFVKHGRKKFILPGSLKYFSILGSGSDHSSAEIKASIQCQVDDYRDWLQNLSVLYDNTTEISSDLYNCLFDVLMANIGLKSKYILDRFKEKGWQIDGK